MAVLRPLVLFSLRLPLLLLALPVALLLAPRLFFVESFLDFSPSWVSCRGVVAPLVEIIIVVVVVGFLLFLVVVGRRRRRLFGLDRGLVVVRVVGSPRGGGARALLSGSPPASRALAGVLLAEALELGDQTLRWRRALVSDMVVDQRVAPCVRRLDVMRGVRVRADFFISVARACVQDRSGQGERLVNEGSAGARRARTLAGTAGGTVRTCRCAW